MTENQKHEWVYDDTVWDSISDCYRCYHCDLTMLIYGSEEVIKTKIKCGIDNRGKIVSSRKTELDKQTIDVSHEDTA